MSVKRYVVYRGVVREGELEADGTLCLGVVPTLDRICGRVVRQMTSVSMAPDAYRSFATKEEAGRYLVAIRLAWEERLRDSKC